MSIKTLLLAGVTVGALGGIAAADPCAPPAAGYQTTSYGAGYQNAGYANEPAPGTYENGYVWVAGAYQYDNGYEQFVAGHWQLAAPQPTVVVRAGWQAPRFERRFERRDDRRDDRRFDRRNDGRTARSYRRGSRY